ncbi:MAG: NAD(P)H-dependent oxidoreductase subunit E [Sedimentisphaerales bacterium]|nr:NAD(P)H-dependent oxidoreductase subunit E [Sedimentisphaerales bacterium]
MMQQKDVVSQKVNNHSQDDINPEDILKILDEHSEGMGSLIAVLEDIQIKYGYLPEKALRIVSEKTNRSLVDIYGVATFYKFFSLHPKGKHLICACLGTACHVRGAPRVVAELEQQLSIKAGQTTEDKEFTLETVNCLGACALGPVVVIDGHYFSKVRRSNIKQLLDKAREGFDKVDIGKDERIFPIEVSCVHCKHSFKDEEFSIDGYPSIGLNAAVNGKKGRVRLSSLYGSYNVSTEFEIPQGMVVSFTCPHCNAEISDVSECPDCGAPLISMLVKGGGAVRICSRRGCKNHMLDLV